MIDKIDVRSVPEGEVCSLEVQLSQRRSKGSRDVAFLNRKPIQLSFLLSGKNGGIHRTDPAGNIKADKEKSTEKIDGAIATIMALDRAIRCRNEKTESVYDTRGLLFI